MEYTIKNPYNNQTFNIRTDLERLGYFGIINEMIVPTKKITIYIDLKLINNNRLGNLMDITDINRKAFENKHNSISWLCDCFKVGWIRFDTEGRVNYSEDVTLNNSIIITS